MTVSKKLATKYSRTAIKVDSNNVEQFAEILAETFPVYAKLPMGGKVVGGPLDGAEYQGNNGIFAMVDNKMKMIGNGVSDNYYMHSNKNVADAMLAVLPVFGGEVYADIAWNDGHTIAIAPTQEFAEAMNSGPDGKLLPAKERIVPRFGLNAGLGGTGGWLASMAIYNPLCMNLLMLKQIDGVNVSIRHTPNMKDQLETMIGQFQGLRGTWSDILGQMRAMKETRVTVADIITQVFGEVPTEGRGKTVAESRVNMIVSRLMREHDELGQAIAKNDRNMMQVDGWRMFNAIQGVFQHDTTRAENNPLIRAVATWNDPKLAKVEKLCLAV